MRLLDITEDLLKSKLPATSVSLIANLFFAFVAAIELPSILLKPTLAGPESIFFQAVKSFIGSPNINAGQLNPYTLKVYLYAIPARLGAGFGISAQVLLMRLSGLVFLMLTLWLAYQTARRVFINNDFISLGVLALLATNNRLLTSSTTIGGDAFLYFFFAFIIYELVEFTVQRSLFDLALVLILIFFLANIDIRLAQNVILPIVFFSIVATMLTTYYRELLELLPPSNKARGAIGAALVIAFLLAQRIPLLAKLLFVPTAFFISAYRIPAWPEVIAYLIAYFSNSPDLTEGFYWAQSGLTITFQLVVLVSAVGLARFIYLGAAQHFEVTKKPLIALSDGNIASGGYQVMWQKPQISVFANINLPAFATIAMIPPTVFAANNTYAVAYLLSEQNLIFLSLPVNLLLAVGMKEIVSIKAWSKALALPIALITFNIAVVLLTILWR